MRVTPGNGFTGDVCGDGNGVCADIIFEIELDDAIDPLITFSAG